MKKENREQYWKNHYLLFLKSELNQREYCIQNDIKYWSFNPWKRKFDKLESATKIQELPIKLNPEKLLEDRIEIILKENIRLSVPETFSTSTLRQIISVLGDKNEN